MYPYGPPLEVSDFSGGITDNYIDGPSNAGQTFDNLLIQKDKKLKSRYGITFYESAAKAQTDLGNTRIGLLIKHNVTENLFVGSGASITRFNGVSWVELKGPTDSTNVAFPTATTNNYFSYGTYKGHSIITSDVPNLPIKIYHDITNGYRLRTVGIPRVDLYGAIALANNLKLRYNLHRVDLTQHSAADNTNSVAATNAFDESSLVTLTNQLVDAYAAHNADAELAVGRVYHPGQSTPTHVLTSTTHATDTTECLTLLDDIKTKYNAHDADATAHTLGSLHQSSTFRIPQFSVTAGSASYIYFFFWKYTYNIDGVTWETDGPVYQVLVSSATSGTKSISSIPQLSNGANGSAYDISNVTCEVYRSIDGGTTGYFLKSLSNGTTTYNDTTSDTTIATAATIYTTGGILSKDPPPRAKYFTSVNDIGVYANLQIGSVLYPNSFITSVPGSMDWVPGSFQDEVETPVTGIGSVGIYPILFCRNRAYRLEGIIDSLGRGTILKKEISRTKGTVSNNSIVQATGGTFFDGPALYFAGENGFYVTDGYTVRPISLHLNTSYAQLVSQSTNEPRIHGEYDFIENRIIWTVTTDNSVGDNQATWTLDLNYVQQTQFGPMGAFTTMSGQGSSFAPTALAFFSDQMVIGHANGYILKFSSTVSTDLKVDTTVAATTWNNYAIIYDYKSCATSGGSNNFFKVSPLVNSSYRNDANTTVQMNYNNNNSGVWQSMKEIRSRSLITWGDSLPPWGDTSSPWYWNVAPLFTAKRRIKSGDMRWMLKQIQITNANTIIYASDNYALSTVNASLATATIASGTWPTDVIDYTISFASDSYTNQYTITNYTSTVLTFSDPLITSPSGSQKWQITGYKKGELVYVLSYSMPFAVAGAIETPWRGVTGGNA